jgi:hypothetical protein
MSVQSKERATRLAVLVVIVLSALPGCGRYYWSKSGATAEHFAGDSRDCLQDATAKVPAAPSTVATEAVEHLYRACLAARGYTRAKAMEPAPSGSYRGIERAEEFAAALPPAVGVPAAAVDPRAHPLDGRWRRVGAPSGSLTVRVSGTDVAWEYESFGSQGLAIVSQYGDPGTIYRGSGTGTVAGDDLTLTGRLTVGDPFSRGPLTFRLTRSGSALKGTAQGPSNVPVDVEFARSCR